MSFVGHERCRLLKELNNQPSRLLLTLKGVVNEQLLPSRVGSVIRTWPLLRTKSGLTTSEQVAVTCSIKGDSRIDTALAEQLRVG